MVTPVNPSVFVMFILSSMFASVAALPSASSTPFPLSKKTLAVVPPAVSSIGDAVKSSSSGVIVSATIGSTKTTSIGGVDWQIGENDAIICV